MKNLRKIKYIVFISILLNNIITAQWNFSLGTSQSYSDNPFNYPIAQSSAISTFDLGIEKQYLPFSFGYYGSYTYQRRKNI